MSAQQRELTLELLMEKAGIQGYLTADDLVAVSPDSAQDKGNLRALRSVLRHRGVDVLDADEETASDIAPAADSSLTDLEPRSNKHLSGDNSISIYLKEMSRVPLLSME
ncbi:MAG: hypothetical protein M1282_01385, partial [Chloroflexi bacterium]|nr:hypothetical protein [Chloroflexota bacterium]